MMMVHAYTDAQMELCRRLTPEIIDLTLDYYSLDKPSPYLDGLASGGLIEDGLDSDDESKEVLKNIEASGLRDTLMPERFPKIGIPEDVAREGLMWVVMTSKQTFHKDRKINPAMYGNSKINHAFAFWDGNEWITRRIKPDFLGQPPSKDWESQWDEGELTEAEQEAIKTTVTQTRSIHEIAHVFTGNSRLFESVISEQLDPGTRTVIDWGLSTPWYILRDKPSIMQRKLSALTTFFSTGYQRLSWYVDVAYKLQEGNSTHLDSGGIMTASYHRPTVPSDPVLLNSGGENILFSNAHPPVPENW